MNNNFPGLVYDNGNQLIEVLSLDPQFNHKAYEPPITLNRNSVVLNNGILQANIWQMIEQAPSKDRKSKYNISTNGRCYGNLTFSAINNNRY